MRPRRLRSFFIHACILIAYGLALGYVLRMVLGEALDVALDQNYLWFDLIGNLAVIGLIWALVRGLWKTLILATVVIVGFQLGNGLKLLILGVPIAPDDFLNVVNLVYLQEGYRRALAVAILCLPLVLLLVFIPWKRLSTWAVLAVVGLLSTTLVAYSAQAHTRLDDITGHSVWDQPANFRKRGLALHIAQESLRTIAKVERTPSREQVDEALQSLVAEDQLTPADLSNVDQRNVHVIVLESFFDPVQLGQEWVPEDPFDPRFRRLWEQTGQSVTLSPVFGGYTANAEFEALCGFPTIENAVFFEGWMRRPVNCLPRLFGQAGFHTVASHPNVAGFWNRTHAYRLAGFQSYLSKSHYDMTESVEGLLLDGSFIAQTLEQLPTDDKPKFNYMLTYFGHLPYPTSRRYPNQVAAGKEARLLTGYLNHVWYKTRGVMDQLEQLRASDPDALIVIFGDHLPFLDTNYGVYRDVLGLPKDRKDFDGDMLEFLTTTPLIIIDGERGPIKVGKLPLYRLPSLILSTMNVDNHGMVGWSVSNSDYLHRPLYGMHINADRTDAKAMACTPEQALLECADSAEWLQHTRTLIADLFTGAQHALNRSGAIE